MNKDSIEQQIKTSLDSLKSSIDIETQVKLNEARHAALNAPKGNFLRKSLAPLSAATAMALIAFTMVSYNSSELTTQEPTLFEDLELLANEADPDFYQDLEFLTWLDENQLMDADI